MNTDMSLVDMVLIGNNISRIRKYHGLTQISLANEAGISRSTMQRIEYGKTVPGFDIMQRICSILQTELETLEEPLPKTIK